MSERARGIAAPALAILAAVALLGALVAGYASRAVLDADQFAARATSALESEAVSAEIGRRVADSLIEAEPDLTAVRPVIEQVVGGVARSGGFQSLFGAAVRDLHRAIFSGDQNTVTLTLGDIGATVRGAISALNPKLAKQISAGADVPILDSEPPDALLAIAEAVEGFRALPWLLLAAGVLLIGAALRVTADRRRILVTLGIAISIGAVVALVGMRALESLVLTQTDEAQLRDAAGDIWDAYLGDLAVALLLAAACGTVIAAAASSLLRPVDIAAPLRRAWAILDTVPESGRMRVLRGVVLLVIGIAIVVRPQPFVALIAILAGLYIAYAGAGELMRLTIAEPGEPTAEAQRGRGPLVAALLVAVTILGAGVLFIGVGGIRAEPATIETEGCNGSEALCEQTLDQVVFAGTHNSMSAASNPDWLFAQHDEGFPTQLADGIRAQFIDAHYGVETESGIIKTDLSDLTGPERAVYEDELGSESLDAALRIRDRIVGSQEVGEREVYLCHRFCELGAISIKTAFSDYRDFLAANPDEVMVVVIEDYVDPKDVVAAVEETGLIDFVYTGPLGPPWPTLEQMIESGGRVVMMAEADAGGGDIPWYHPAYEELVQETPYTFKTPDALIGADNLDASCEPNRGPDDAPIFLINHWVDSSPAPKPSNAEKVNGRDALLGRIERCEELRGIAASLISVDFYARGDLFEVVDELNSTR